MIDAIPSRPTATTAAKTSAAKTAAASAVQGSFQSALASTAEKVSEPQDTLQISGMSDWEKLAELKRLHEQTDYSNMSIEEKIRLIDERWSCFPIYAMSSSLYGPVCINGKTGEPMNKYSVRDHVVIEHSRQLKEAGIKYKPGQYRKAMYGDMSDEEVIAALTKKYSGGSMIDRAGMLAELGAMKMDGNDGQTCFRAIDAMRSRLLYLTGGTSSFDLSAGSPWQESKIEQFAFSTKISWATLGQMLKEYANQNGEEASLDWLLEELGKHTDSTTEKESAQRQLQLKQMLEDQVQEKQAREQETSPDWLAEEIEKGDHHD